MNNDQKGFSLGELLIIIAIIAVLVSITIPIFQGKKKAAIDATNKANIRIARSYMVSCGLAYNLENKDCFDIHANVFWYDIKDGKIKVLNSMVFKNNSLFKSGSCENWDWIKENGVYRYILVMYYYDKNNDLQILTKPFINNEGEVIFGCASNGAKNSVKWEARQHEKVMNCHPEYDIDKYNPEVY